MKADDSYHISIQLSRHSEAWIRPGQKFSHYSTQECHVEPAARHCRIVTKTQSLFFPKKKIATHRRGLSLL